MSVFQRFSVSVKYWIGKKSKVNIIFIYIIIYINIKLILRFGIAEIELKH